MGGYDNWRTNWSRLVLLNDEGKIKEEKKEKREMVILECSYL